jgi:hypothetical protein
VPGQLRGSSGWQQRIAQVDLAVLVDQQRAHEEAAAGSGARCASGR